LGGKMIERKYTLYFLIGTAIGILLLKYSLFYLPLGMSIGGLIGLIFDSKNNRKSN
jgi:F0F1-type ATP synthase assembly protein I